MATLKNLLYNSYITSVRLQEFVVLNDTFSVNNGGCCCLWTVPASVKYIKFEMWGGGGGGAGGCCCQQGSGGSGGSYAVKTLTGAQVVSGCQYTICAAGSTAQSNTCCGFPGNTSYVTGFNLSNFCARGGCQGMTTCAYNSTNPSFQAYSICCAVGGDINIPATQSLLRANTYCYYGIQMLTSVAPATVSGPIIGPVGCSVAGAGECGALPPPVVPGGGGHSATTHAGLCRCGWWGAPGAVIVTYG